MFSVSTMADGLSNKEAVLNIQRHLYEGGPAYMSFETTEGFMDWDWARNPVYTGRGNVRGGHAVTGVGWGTQGSTDYWLLRNSWGTEWAERGYFKFKRGVNLDKIEASECSIPMQVEKYADWSAPVCNIDS